LRSSEDPEFFLNQKNSEGQTLLYVASKNGSLGTLDLLLRYKAQVSILSRPTGSSQLVSPIFPAAM
jgi:ankyrin repeat protein